MKKLYVVLLMGILAGSIFAQVGSISGFVYNVSTSQPIAGAYVIAQGPSGGNDSTCIYGGYLINNLASGYYTVHASAPGFQPSSRCSVLVHPGQNTPNINFHLAPTGPQPGSISGFVYNVSTSQPIAGAYVIAQGPSGGNDSTCMYGGYLINNLTSGYYTVHASAPGFQPSSRCSVLVHPGQNTPNINFHLAPTGQYPGCEEFPNQSGTISLTCYPNPFTKSSTISFGIDKKTNVRLTVFDLTGKIVRHLLDSSLEPGSHLFVWNGQDDYGDKVPIGVYIYKLETNPRNFTAKTIIFNK